MNIIGTIALLFITPVIEDFFHPEITAIKNKVKDAWASYKNSKPKQDEEDD